MCTSSLIFAHRVYFQRLQFSTLSIHRRIRACVVGLACTTWLCSIFTLTFSWVCANSVLGGLDIPLWEVRFLIAIRRLFSVERIVCLLEPTRIDDFVHLATRTMRQQKVSPEGPWTTWSIPVSYCDRHQWENRAQRCISSMWTSSLRGLLNVNPTTFPILLMLLENQQIIIIELVPIMINAFG